VTEVEIVSFQLTAEPLFSVIYTANSGMLRKDRALEVVGVVLSKTTTLAQLSPVTYFKLEPAFIFKNDVVLGASYWDPEKARGEITVTPIKCRNKARKSCST
jgi:hypothetical protein